MSPSIQLGISNLPALLNLILLAAGAPMAGPTEADAPDVSTRSASALGLDAMTVNGSIQPRGRLTSYYFEYGPKPDYNMKTPVRALPPRLAAFYHESWDDGLGGWQSWFQKSHFKTGGV